MGLRLVSAFLAVSLLGLIGFAAFWAGRISAPAPRFEPSAHDANDPLGAAWADFARAQGEILGALRQSDFYGDDQERAEAHRAVLYALVGAIEMGALLDPERPRFLRAPDWTSKGGLQNPDDVSFVARVRDDADYRITGTRGTSSSLSFQLLAAPPGVGEADAGAKVAVLDERSLVVAADGGFEVIVSRRDPGAERNWLRMTRGASTLLVRHSLGAWETERAGALAIERIGGETPALPLLDTEEMAARLRAAARTLFDRGATWQDYAQRAWTFLPRNGVSEARPSTGGLAGHYSALGSFELDDDEALVVTTHASDAAYQGAQLGSLWFVSLDPASRPSSLNTAQAHRSADGLYHFVVSRRDPGIQNWLDPGGHRRGLIMLRWQGLARPLPTTQQPSARVVAFDRLRGALPNVPRFGPEERAAQIRRRHLAVQGR